MWFEIVTWPGCLTIHGDMGSWTFSRLQDMFDFFRCEKLKINEYYWSEKLQHGTYGGREGAMVWDEDTFKEEIIESLGNWGLEPEDLETVKDALDEEVFNRDGKWEMMTAAHEFSCETTSGKVRWDCEMPDGKVYAYHFTWCCYAIVWAIQQYDAHKCKEVSDVGSVTVSS